MRIPALAALSAAVLVAVAHPSGAAAAKAFHIADKVGDANGVNGQGIGMPLPSTATAPADLAGADITGIDFVNHFKGSGKTRKPYGFDVTLHLAGPLQTGTVITITMVGSMSCGDSDTIQLGAGTSSLAVCQATKTGDTGPTVGTSEVSSDKKSVTWSIDPIYKAGTRISAISASTSVFVLGVFDEAGSDGPFVYGK